MRAPAQNRMSNVAQNTAYISAVLTTVSRTKSIKSANIVPGLSSLFPILCRSNPISLGNTKWRGSSGCMRDGFFKPFS